MLGGKIADPNGVESGGELHGMELLPVDTVFLGDKTTVQVTGTFENISGSFAPLSGTRFEGYEIHMGESVSAAAPLTTVNRNGVNVPDGTFADNIAGTYVHGLFDSAEAATALIKLLAERKGITLDAFKAIDSRDYKETQYDLLAASVREALDMDAVYKILKAGI
jgi:adenosylcobyric acid synthase